MNGLADIDGFKICIQVCVWLGFPPLKTVHRTQSINLVDMEIFVIKPTLNVFI